MRRASPGPFAPRCALRSAPAAASPRDVSPLAQGARSALRSLMLLLPAVTALLLVLLLDGRGGAQEGSAPGGFTVAVAKAAPSVVRIELPETRARGLLPRRALFREVAARESGAGVVVGPDLVLTHAAVVAFDAPSFTVTTVTGQRVQATVARLDADDEVAVLRAGAPLDAPLVVPGRSAPLRAGNLVLALGDPFGTARDAAAAASLGVVEGRTRLDAAEATFAGEVLLTSARINPGCEGGPLVDLDGRLLGLVAPLARDRRTGALVGHALPIEAVWPHVEGARRGPRGKLGLVGRSGAGAGEGVMIERLAPNGPAAAAGARVGDRLRRLADRDVGTNEELRRALAARAAGEKVALRLRRGDAELVVEATLAPVGEDE